MVGASVAHHVQQAFGGDVIDEPGYFIRMALDDHFVRLVGRDHPDGRPVHIGKLPVDIRTGIIQPPLQPSVLKSGGRRGVDVLFEKRFCFFVYRFHRVSFCYVFSISLTSGCRKSCGDSKEKQK